jgi:heme-degrading monooxygenase HmoA
VVFNRKANQFIERKVLTLNMLVSLTIVRYPKIHIPLAFFSMAFLRMPLFFNQKIKFYKLLGCGKNGTFDINPDYQQWGLMTVWDSKEDFLVFRNKSFVWEFWRLFTTEQWNLLCIPFESHGKWDGKEPFGNPTPDRNYVGKIAVLTRATIRLSKLKSFWKNVPTVASSMNDAEGFITSVGIGEMPFVKQATFSVWENLDAVKKFAYRQRQHAEVIKKTRQEDWYSEDLFARFIPIESDGTIHGEKIKI